MSVNLEIVENIISQYGFSRLNRNCDITELLTLNNIIYANHYTEVLHELCHYFAASDERKKMNNFGLPLTEDECQLQDYIDEYYALQLTYMLYYKLLNINIITYEKDDENYMEYFKIGASDQIHMIIRKIDKNIIIDTSWCSTFIEKEVKKIMSELSLHLKLHIEILN